jgi:ribose 5-phosphate isomerase A
VREKIVAASSRELVILVGGEKIVPQIGARGRLPVEVVPFALPLAERLLAKLGLRPVLWEQNGRPGETDNGNYILDCGTDPIPDPGRLDADIQKIPGVVGTGLFVSMASLVLVGDGADFRLTEERRRK